MVAMGKVPETLATTGSCMAWQTPFQQKIAFSTRHSQGAEYEADALAVALQQIAQGGQAQHNAGNGDGQGFQKVFHTLIPRQCF